MVQLLDLDIKEIRELKTDDRGRPCLGQDYADQYIKAAILTEDSSDWLGITEHDAHTFMELLEERVWELEDNGNGDSEEAEKLRRKMDKLHRKLNQGDQQ